MILYNSTGKSVSSLSVVLGENDLTSKKGVKVAMVEIHKDYCLDSCGG